MCRYIIAGDTHGTLDIMKCVNYFYWHEGEDFSNTYLIILGDVGVVGFDSEREKETRGVIKSFPVKATCFIDGNHEHHQRLNEYPVDIWNGGKVHFIEENIIHLMRGQVFNIEGTKFFTMGGAYSVDKMYRTEGISWFPEEIPTKEEYEAGWENLEKNDWNVNYILTHTAPREVAEAMGYIAESEEEQEIRQYLQRTADITEFKAWYFGHFHEDVNIKDKYFCLYKDLVTID